MTNIGTAPLPREPYAGLPDLPEFTLTSTDIQDGGTAPEWMLSALFGVAGGQDRSPQLSWSGFPEGTKSFVLTCFDPDAPTPSGWWHWAVLDIDAATPYLAQNVGRSDLFLEGACFHARNDLGTWSYYGPYPPAGDGPHRYIFTVYALDVPTLELDGDTSIAAVAFHALSHTLARAELTVTYEIKA